MTLDEIYIKLDELSRLDLSSYPVAQINDILNDLGHVKPIFFTLNKGESIIRARPNKEDTEVFYMRGQLSYRPQACNKTYQRASTPNKTMYYGCVIPQYKGVEEDFKHARLTAFTEASKTFRTNPYLAEEKITFSRWEVLEDINLSMIAFHTRFLREGSLVRKLNQRFRKLLQGKDKDLVYKSLVINEFFSDQFANAQIRYDYDYLITALFAEHQIKQGFEGVFYPSVRADGLGYNICILPETADSKLKLTVVGEGRLYKKGKHSIVGSENEAIIDDDSKSFTLKRVSKRHYTSRADALREIQEMKDTEYSKMN